MRPVCIIFISIFFNCKVFSQGEEFTHPGILGFQYSRSNFNNNKIFDLRGSDAGIGIHYVKGAGKNLDWDFRASIVFSSIAQKNFPAENKYLFNNLEGNLRGRLFGENRVIQPFLMGGPGMAVYRGLVAPYFNSSAGLQFQYRGGFLILSSSYKSVFSNELKSHFQTSVTFAGILFPQNPKRKKSTTISTAIQEQKLIDTDGDGISNEDDSCPDIPGYASLNGCPPKKVENTVLDKNQNDSLNKKGPSQANKILTESSSVNTIQLKINLAASNIHFNTGSFELTSASYVSLHEIGQLLKSHERLQVIIEGHTDSFGSEMDNQALSEKRANSVRDYLMLQGIEFARMVTIGYGESQPLSDNNTKKGREQNRRVQFKLSIAAK